MKLTSLSNYRLIPLPPPPPPFSHPTHAGGRAEAIRLALHVGGVPFDDVRITEKEFGKAKKGTVQLLARPSIQRAGFL